MYFHFINLFHSNDTHPAHGVSEGKISKRSSISVILSGLTLSDLPSEIKGEVQEHGNKELWSIKQLSGCNAACFVTYLHLQFALLLREPCPTAARHTVLWTHVCKIWGVLNFLKKELWGSNGKKLQYGQRYFLITCYCLSYTGATSSTVLDMAQAFNEMEKVLFAFKTLLKRIFLNHLQRGSKRGVKIWTKETPGELGRTELQNSCFLHTPLRWLMVKCQNQAFNPLLPLQNLGGGRASLPACQISLFPSGSRKAWYTCTLLEFQQYVKV